MKKKTVTYVVGHTLSAPITVTHVLPEKRDRETEKLQRAAQKTQQRVAESSMNSRKQSKRASKNTQVARGK